MQRFLPGGANERTVLIDVTDFGADPTGVLDSSAAVVAAMESGWGVGQVVYFPTGTYRLDTAINVSYGADNRTIRGDGPALTILRPGANGIVFSASDGWTWPIPAAQVVSGLSKNSTSLVLDDSSAFTVGALILIAFGNQQNDSAIEAGAPVVFGVGGSDPAKGLRQQVTIVTGKVGSTISFFPGIYCDIDPSLGASVRVAQLQHDFFGIESLRLDMSGSISAAPIQMSHGNACWVYDVEISDMHNYGVQLLDSFQCEVRQCYLHDRQGGGSNGAAVLVNTSSGCLVEDNIIVNVFPNIEVNQGSSGNAFAYNVLENEPEASIIYNTINSNHGPHNSFNLFEGNVSPNIQCDGYFGSCSEDTVYRNWFHGSCFDLSSTTFTFSLKRFTRDYNVAGNILGRTGVKEGAFNLGEPNIGNNDFDGTAEPTAGDFWEDWKATAELTTRTSDTAGTITLAGGSAFTGQLMSIQWASGTQGQSFTNSAVVGNNVTWSGGSGQALPVLGTIVNVFFQPGGYQELDLDVENSMINKGNYLYGLGGSAGSMSPLDGDTLIDSFLYGSTPSWWDIGLAFPAFDPESPEEANYGAIPAGVRFMAMEPLEEPEITDPCTISGSPVEGQILTAVPGGVTGNPTPTRTWKWQRDGVDIVGATSITYLLTETDVGTEVGPIQIETNTEGMDQSVATPLDILDFEGDLLVVDQVANAAPVTELWLRGAVTAGVIAAPSYYLVQHSGPYPTQPDNNFAYARFGTPQDNVYVFQGTISESEAIASVP